MKTLFVIRHAKSSWKDEGLSDMDRPLKKRGRSDALIMAKVLHRNSINPQQIVSSPALRARTTAEIIAMELGFDSQKIEINKQLYFEGVENIFKVIHSLTEDVVFIFGHNPEFTDLVNMFTTKEIDNLPTCGIVGVEFKINDWSEASKQNGKLAFYDFPKRHRE